MRKISNEEFISLIETLKAKNIIPYGVGEIPQLKPLKEYIDDLYGIYYLFELGEPISKETFSHYNNDSAYNLALYYKAYVMAFGKEPFNLAQELYDNIQVGIAYGHPFNICLSKQMLKNKKFKVSYLYVHPEAEPMPFPKYTRTFDFSFKNQTLLTDARSYDFLFSQGWHEFDAKTYTLSLKNLIKQSKSAIKELKKLQSRTK